MKKISLVLILSILMLSISGCTEEGIEDITTDISSNTNSISDNLSSYDLLPVVSLPENYEFLGSRDISMGSVSRDYVQANGFINGTEGLYMYNNSVNLYVDVIEMNTTIYAESFILDYKSDFDELPTTSRFVDETINGHSVTRILSNYVTYGGEANVPRYQYIWNNGKFVFVVGGATEDFDLVFSLAESIGY